MSPPPRISPPLFPLFLPGLGAAENWVRSVFSTILEAAPRWQEPSEIPAGETSMAQQDNFIAFIRPIYVGDDIPRHTYRMDERFNKDEFRNCTLWLVTSRENKAEPKDSPRRRIYSLVARLKNCSGEIVGNRLKEQISSILADPLLTSGQGRAKCQEFVTALVAELGAARVGNDLAFLSAFQARGISERLEGYAESSAVSDDAKIVLRRLASSARQVGVVDGTLADPWHAVERVESLAGRIPSALQTEGPLGPHFMVELAMSYSEINIQSDRHDYELKIELENFGRLVVKDWVVTATIPSTFLMNPTRFGNERDQCSQGYRCFEWRGLAPIYPGERSTDLTTPYTVDNKIFEADHFGAKLFDQQVTAKAFVGDHQADEIEREMRSLHHF